MLQDLFNSEATIRIIDLFIINIQQSGKHCVLYSISFDELLEEINKNNPYRKIDQPTLCRALGNLMRFNVIIEETIASKVKYSMDSYWYCIFEGIQDKIMWYLW